MSLTTSLINKRLGFFLNRCGRFPAHGSGVGSRGSFRSLPNPHYSMILLFYVFIISPDIALHYTNKHFGYLLLFCVYVPDKLKTILTGYSSLLAVIHS